MTVAIDETGDFNETSDSHSFFVAAYVQSENGQHKIKQKQFEDWESTLPDIVKTKKGEVKGNSLNEGQLQAFLKSVIFKLPEVRVSYVSLIPAHTSPEIIKKYQRFEIRQVDYSLQTFINSGSKKKNINFLREYSKWLNKRPLKDFMKMLCLKNSLLDTLKNTMIYGIVNDKIDELLNISYKVDRDFLTEENMYWSEYARRSVQENSKSKPFPMLDTWDKDHPVKKKYLVKRDNGKDGINLNIIFKDNLKFVDSRDHFEVRIADILGIIVNRFWNKGEMKMEYDFLTKIWPVKDGHIQLHFDDFDEETLFEQYQKDLD